MFNWTQLAHVDSGSFMSWLQELVTPTAGATPTADAASSVLVPWWTPSGAHAPPASGLHGGGGSGPKDPASSGSGTSGVGVPAGMGAAGIGGEPGGGQGDGGGLGAMTDALLVRHSSHAAQHLAGEDPGGQGLQVVGAHTF